MLKTTVIILMLASYYHCGAVLSNKSEKPNNEVISENIISDKIITHVTLTCYQPVEEQCDKDPLVTADGSKIDLKSLESGEIKWCAVSRDLLWLFPKNKPRRVHIEGYGIYEVRDVMNKKWNHRIDILIHPNDDFRVKKSNVKVEIL